MGVKQPRQQGVTLIELIIAIVVLGIAAVGILTALGRNTVLNVDPMIRAQSLALAQSFMDEVSSKPFYRPENDPTLDDGNDGSLTCDDTVPNLDGPRNTATDNGDFVFLSICDYDGYHSGLENNGEGGIYPADELEEIENLSGYDVSVSVDTGNTADPVGFAGVENNCIVRITVSIDDPLGTTTRLRTYRTSYWDECP